MLWRSARAKILAQDGELERAEALACEAVRLGAQTDLVNTHADALSDLAEVLARAGRRDEALTAFDEASERYRQKGNLTSLGRTRDLARELAAPVSSDSATAAP
jgi:tetratricopeptide (TPR) repeat protein